MFQRAVFGFWGDPVPDDVKKWQSKSAYEAGRCNDVQIRDAETPELRKKYIDEALRYYKTVAEKFPNSPEAPGATQRIAELGKL